MEEINNFSYVNLASFLSKFAKLGRIVVNDPNTGTKTTSSYKKYTRENVLSYLQDPRKNSEKLIDASVYLYTTVVLYKRICSYLSSLPTYDYVLSPVGIAADTDPEKYIRAYYKALLSLDNMNVKQLCKNIVNVAIREGAYFGVEISDKNSYMAYQFPYKYCKVVSWEDGCPLFALDMQYFDQTGFDILLDTMPAFVKSAYNQYKKDRKMRWADMPSESSICILADETLDFVVPPLSGCFPDLYLIDEYKDLVQSKSIIELYKLLCLKMPSDDNGELTMDEGVAQRFYNHIAEQLPAQIGLAMSPFDLDSVSFDKTNVDIDMTSRAERDLFGTVGISQMVMSNSIEAASAIKYSIVNDFSFMRPILDSLARWLNKKLKLASGATKYQVIFADANIYTKDDYADKLLKGMQYGVPNKSMYCAVAMGYTPSQMIGMNFLETQVLDLPNTFIPPQSANTASGDAGRPQAEDGDLTPEGTRAREKETKVK